MDATTGLRRGVQFTHPELDPEELTTVHLVEAAIACDMGDMDKVVGLKKRRCEFSPRLSMCFHPRG